MYPLFVGKNRIHLAETDSTNNYAFQLLKEKNQFEGTLITATAQVNGRGQRGNNWLTEAGLNFTGSYIFHPVFLAANHQFWLNKAIALAVVDTLESYIPSKEINIKWPNDILVDKQKIAGILIESQISGNLFTNVVLGIGVNVNQTKLPDSTYGATSIVLQTKKETDLESFTNKLSACLEVRYMQVKAGNYRKIDSDYQKWLFGKDKTVSFEWNGDKLEGIIIEVDNNGQLVIDVLGNSRRFSNGEIKLLG